MAKKKAKTEPVTAEPGIRNRIKRHVRMRAGDLVPHDGNWRTHPPEQADAPRGLYDEVGFARSLLAYEQSDGRLKLIDGHLRRDLGPDMMVTVEVLDVSDDEAKKLLAVIDPLSAMAGRDEAALTALLASVSTGSGPLQAMLDGLTNQPIGPGVPAVEPTPPSEFGAYDENVPTEHTCPKCGFAWSGGEGNGEA